MWDDHRKRLVLGALLGAALFACSEEDSAKMGTLEITVSAESLGANGYAFPPAAGQEVAFVDGWAVNFERILVCIDKIRLSEAPDRDPGDPSVLGETLALREGPFVVDLAKPGDALDRGGAGRVAIRLPIDDLTGIFEADQRYAFSFDLVAPTADAVFVNVEPDDQAVTRMIEGEARALLSGRADLAGTDCTSSDPAYDFSSLPSSVAFEFEFSGNVHSRNCQNPDNTGGALEGEESQRGIQLLSRGTTTAQITVHTDHLFWPATSHENLPLFNHFAAHARETENGHLVTMAELEQVSLPAITDAQGTPLPWRSCVDEALYHLPSQPTQMTFDSGSVALSNLAEFVGFNASTMGHLNADGLCYSEPY